MSSARAATWRRTHQIELCANDNDGDILGNVKWVIVANEVPWNIPCRCP